MTKEELDEIRARVPLRLSDSADVDTLLHERELLLLQVDELMKALKAIGQYIPANLDPRGEVTYQVFIPGSAIAPAWNILHGVIEKPVGEKINPTTGKSLCQALREQDGLHCWADRPCPVHDVEKRNQEPPIENPQPLGTCKRCGTPFYTPEGFCGGCNYGKVQS